jgi:superfamily II DNA or RNA helicase
LRALAAARSVKRDGFPLAIELRLELAGLTSGGAPPLTARLMRPGARGGWVNGSLDWGGLESWRVRSAGYREDHGALLGELYTVFRLRPGGAGLAYGGYGGVYGTQRSVDLASCASPYLWQLLDEAARLGLALVHARPELGEVGRPLSGDVVIDVTRPAGGPYLVGAALHVENAPAEHLAPVRPVGSPGHGLVCVERSDVEAGRAPEDWRIRLVRLARPLAAELQRMLLSGDRLRVPESELERFSADICPALGRVARLVSTDGSFTPPVVSEPSLVLQARHGPGTLVTLAWQWRYEVAGSERRAPLAPDDGANGFRDLDAERRRLLDTVVDEPALRELGLLDASGRPVAGPLAAACGLDALSLATDVLPRLEGHGGMIVESGGEPLQYRDVGESLTVGVSTSEIAGERDWFDLGVTITVAGREVPFVDVFTALAQGETRMVLDDGGHFSLADPRLESLRTLIEEARALVDAPPSSLRISRYQAGLWSDLVELGVVTAQAERWARAVGPLAALTELRDHEPPGELRAELRPYQREGFAWLASLWELELGGILADDMGLGKTLQALALICHARERDPELGPFLVVAPTSVAPNWAAEAGRFAPGLRVEVVLDTLARSGRPIEEIATADVVVTTYTLFRLDADAHTTVAWAGLLLDEAQFVKNHRGKTYRCARELAAPFKLAITGTPMENNLMELWALLSLSAPGLFPDPKRFADHYARPIERDGGEVLERLRRRIKPLMKRRTKELVASELPHKQEQILAVDLHPRHRRVYDTHLQRERQRVLALLGDFERNRITILSSITRLRQLSLHPGLVEPANDAIPCAKLDALVEQLGDVVGAGHRALVFSQFTRFLGRARDRLRDEGVACSYLDGKTRRRKDAIERFRRGTDPVFLISLKAGGVGLNLTEADYCFLLDPWWNPATEAQAIDRTHRIGQTRAVMVYRLIARNTIEEKVRALAERKAELFDGVVDDGALFAGAVTAEDIRGLLD